MRLRTFIILSSLALVAVLGIIFSFQLRRILDQNFREIADQQERDLFQIIVASLEAKKSSMTSYGKLLNVNFDLAGIFVIAEETGDARMIAHSLDAIRGRTGFDVVDVFGPRGGTSMVTKIVIPPAQFADIVQRADGLTVINQRGGPMLTGIYPLRLYDDTVGYVLLGMCLNRAIAGELGSDSRARVNFTLGTRPPPTGGARVFDVPFKGLEKSTLAMALAVDRDAFQKINRALTRNLIFFVTLCLGLLGTLIYFSLEFGVLRKFQTYLAKIDGASQDLVLGKLPSVVFPKDNIVEMDRLARSFNQFSQSLLRYEENSRIQSQIAADAKKRGALADLAQQVAHNIRSPLSALDMLITAADGLNQDTRLLVRGAMQRIQNIASNLLEKNPSGTAARAPVPLYETVAEIVAEKRVEHKNRSGLDWELNAADDVAAIFVDVENVEFKAAISNLLQNAAESVEGPGTVRISLLAGARLATVRIDDNGRGIPADVLPRLGEWGATFGKASGTGIGMFHARKTVKDAGGEFSVSSQVGAGTTVEITLPRIDPPRWYVGQLTLNPGAKIAIVDDDPLILEAWAQKLGGAGLEPEKDFRAFTRVDAFRDWFESEGGDAGTLLIDLEIPGGWSGLECIEAMNLADRAILVTARYEDPQVIRRCEDLGVRLLPKSRLRNLKIQFADFRAN